MDSVVSVVTDSMNSSNHIGGVPRLLFRGVSLWTPDGNVILKDVSWTVCGGEQWVLLGPNGAGKSTLLALAGAVRHPSRGEVSVLGGQLGRVDMPALRRRIGVVNPSSRILEWLTAEEVVLTGVTGTVRPLPGSYGLSEQRRARDLLEMLNCANLLHRIVSTCSQGERQRIRLARALMPRPALLLLDEPAVGLDLPAREGLMDALASLTVSEPELSSVLVTHHLEEIPSSTTHALLLRAGHVVQSAPVAEALTSETVSDSFGFPVQVSRHGNRWMAQGVASWAIAAEARPGAMPPVSQHIP